MKVVVNPMFFLCIIALCTGCNHSSEKVENKLPLVQIAEVKESQAETYKEFPFISQPYRTSELSFRVGGPIARFDVYVGNFYKRGAVIAEIDARDFQLRKERAQAIYVQARAEFDRIEVLYRKENLSASVYERAKSDCIAAKMAFEAAKNELVDTKLIAPFDGYVGAVYMEKYQDVKPTQPVISLVDISKLKIETSVNQDIAYNSQDLKQVDLYFDTAPQKRYSADVVEISKSTTQNNLSYLLTALLPNIDGDILAGMSGNLHINTKSTLREKEILVPQAALSHRDVLGDFVWVIDQTTRLVSCRSVTIDGMRANGEVAIVSGIVAGEQVAVSGLRFLSDGMKVEVTKKS